jgi:hypothetical protein
MALSPFSKDANYAFNFRATPARRPNPLRPVITKAPSCHADRTWNIFETPDAWQRYRISAHAAARFGFRCKT